MAGELSGGTTNLSNLSVGGSDANGSVFGALWVGSNLSAPNAQIASGMSTSRITATSDVSTLGLVVGTSGITVQGGAIISGVTLDLRTNAVIPSAVTYAGGASISGLTIGQWGFVFNASGLSIAFSSGKTAYFFGGSTLSAAIT